MAKKKKEEKKEIIKEKPIENIEKYSISELLEKNRIKPLYAVGFLNAYGLTEDFKKEVEINEVNIKFSDEEFNKMYENYIKREI